MELGWSERGDLILLGNGWPFLLQFAELFGGEKGFMAGFLGDCAVLVAKVLDPLILMLSHLIILQQISYFTLSSAPISAGPGSL